MDMEGQPSRDDPRGILGRALDDARQEGYDLFTGPEMEFWLFDAPRKRSPALFHDQGTYFDLFPADNGVDIRREIVLALTDLGYQVEASHHEVARGQHEIPFRYGPALATADRIVTFREVARAVAARYGATASFIAKPEAGINGNAMHIHASLRKDGKNAFFDPAAPDGISRTALFFIGGLLAHAKGLCRVANPTINSYKRLTPGYEAPCTISWSTANRSALVRVPAARGEGTRVELRNPDAMANPYLLLAAMLAAGMDGVRRRLEPRAITTGNAYTLPEADSQTGGGEMLPGTLEAAQACLWNDRLSWTGRRFFDDLAAPVGRFLVSRWGPGILGEMRGTNP
jgi:glutamine synthetase